MRELLELLQQDLFTKVAGLANLVAATISLLSIASGFAMHWIAARKKLVASEEQTFRAALESSDLVTLGDYLSTALGRFTIQEYSNRQQVAERIDRMLDRLVEFVAEPESEQPLPPQRPVIALSSEAPLASGEFARVRTDIENDEVWNGLARLRRVIELRLRRFAVDRGFKDKHLRSAGQALRVLTDRGHVPERIAEPLQYAIRICNEGVHGNTVSLDDALAALSISIDALESLDRL
ncbi:MAG: hypothetical protein ABMA15_19815 [Vicinamibacterales bacterium]